MKHYPSKQQGLSILEFTFVASALLIVLFSILELAIYFYSLQQINEATRLSARLAVVCRVDDRNDIPALVVPASPPRGFSAANIQIDYLTRDGSTVDLSSTGAFESISFARARVINYSYQFSGVLGLFSALGLFPVPEFESIRPRENLGFIRQPSGSPIASTDC
ncbi:TadE/TadG family type IV pilus assembly protein [Vibrio astriarenae]|uniref:TadE/TadG family type IV pilus assembly protein n=1 Tax=Vibrio astriarenae TaxID=1481923 RepID=UPI003734F087